MADRNALLIGHPIFGAPAFGRNHPLSIMRHGAFLDLCRAMNWLESARTREAPLPEIEFLKRFHTPEYLNAFETSARDMVASADTRKRFNIGTMECPLFDGLWERARASVGGSVLAADLALRGYTPFHPGGGTHHGRPSGASGFCYLNDPVFAILGLLDAGRKRVLYIDLDAHHGDGVEAAFATDARVHLVSLHEQGRWPGTGQTGDTHSPRIINIPLPRHINDDEFMFVFRALCRRRLAVIEPDAVVITCGADSLKGDPLSSMELSNGALCQAVVESIQLSDCALVLGGGGYNPWTTARLWARLWATLNGFEVPDVLPTDALEVLDDLSCDLVDREDMDPKWLTSIADDGNPGPIRTQLHELVATVCALHLAGNS